MNPDRLRIFFQQDAEDVFKRGLQLNRPAIRNTKKARAALDVSAARFIAYCAFARFARRHPGAFLPLSFVIVLRVPRHVEVSELIAAAKSVLKLNPEIWIGFHAEKDKRGHSFDAADVLKSSRVVVFAYDDSELHPSLLIAVNQLHTVEVALPRHFESLARMMGCGLLSQSELETLRAVPMDQYDAIFRVQQSASAALGRIPRQERLNGNVAEKPLMDPMKGFGEAGRWARNLRDDINDWRAGKIQWSDIDQGILIYGPSGTGKTLFAKTLAETLGLTIIATSVQRWQSEKDGHLGDLLKAMYATFAAAQLQAPSLLFLDEIDSIGHRERFPSRHENYSMQVVNGLLESLDGVIAREGVIVIGACNYPEKIDPALLRSGRLEKHVHFPLPDAKTRLEIFETYLPHLTNNPRLEDVAKRIPGKTGADINQIVREAKRLARRSSREVTVTDLEYLTPPPRFLSETELFRVSVHEAGHAVIADLLDVGIVQEIEVFDNNNTHSSDASSHGLTRIDYHNTVMASQTELLAKIAMLLAGLAAEEIIFGDKSTGAGGCPTSDLDRATRLAMEMVTIHGLGPSLSASYDALDRLGIQELWKDEAFRVEVNSILDTEYLRVTELLSRRKSTLSAIANALKGKMSLSGDDLYQLLRSSETPEFGISSTAMSNSPTI